jgi:hypothetical protein
VRGNRKTTLFINRAGVGVMFLVALWQRGTTGLGSIYGKCQFGGVPSAVKALIPHNRTGIQARGVLAILKKNGCFYRWDCLFSHWAKVNGHVMRVPEIKSIETTAFR